jgi:hypothetical protein
VATALSIIAILIALGSLFVAIRSARASARSADAAEAVDRRERAPRLAIHLDSPTPAPNDRVIYPVRNDGPQDLDSVLMYQPRTRDRITYPVMRTGDPNGWADDEAELGPLAMTQEVAVTLCCGAAGELPDFRVRVVCRAGDETCELPIALPDPRTGAVLQ